MRRSATISSNFVTPTPIRVKRGLSQEALAVDANIDRTYVSCLERTLENPTVAVLERIAVALEGDI